MTGEWLELPPRPMGCVDFVVAGVALAAAALILWLVYSPHGRDCGPP